MTTHTYGIEKLTMRLTVKLPDNYADVQRLYDYGAWFRLQRERVTDLDRITHLIEYIKNNGGRQIDENIFIDDDDLQEKHTITYELVKHCCPAPKTYVIKAEMWYAAGEDDIWGNYIDYEDIAKKYICITPEQIESYLTTVREEIKKDPNWSSIYTADPQDKYTPKVWAEEITIEGL